MPDLRQPAAEQKHPGLLAHPDLEWREVVLGQKPGDALVRIATHKGFRRVGPGLLVARRRAEEPTTLRRLCEQAADRAVIPHSRLGRAFVRLKRVVLGSPIPTS